MLKVLIIDDEQEFSFYLRDIINWDNYNCKIVATCETGDEALEIMENQPVDLMLIDLKILKITGLELIQEMKSRAYSTKVIALANPVLLPLIYNTSSLFFALMRSSRQIHLTINASLIL